MSENTNQTGQLIAARLRDCREAKGDAGRGCRAS